MASSTHRAASHLSLESHRAKQSASEVTGTEPSCSQNLEFASGTAWTPQCTANSQPHEPKPSTVWPLEAGQVAAAGAALVVELGAALVDEPAPVLMVELPQLPVWVGAGGATVVVVGTTGMVVYVVTVMASGMVLVQSSQCSVYTVVVLIAGGAVVVVVSQSSQPVATGTQTGEPVSVTVTTLHTGSLAQAMALPARRDAARTAELDLTILFVGRVVGLLGSKNDWSSANTQTLEEPVVTNVGTRRSSCCESTEMGWERKREERKISAGRGRGL